MSKKNCTVALVVSLVLLVGSGWLLWQRGNTGDAAELVFGTVLIMSGGALGGSLIGALTATE